MTNSEFLESSVVRQLPLKIIRGCRDLKVRAEAEAVPSLGHVWRSRLISFQSQGISFRRLGEELQLVQ